VLFALWLGASGWVLGIAMAKLLGAFDLEHAG
jgi:hypothetical protein